jgi:hypothetical protein
MATIRANQEVRWQSVSYFGRFGQRKRFSTKSFKRLTMTGRNEQSSVFPRHMDKLELGERSGVSGTNDRDLAALILVSGIIRAHVSVIINSKS